MASANLALSASLPERPDLDQLKLQAREQQRGFAKGDDQVRARLAAYLPRRAPDQKLTLSDAQYVIARTYGFGSWPRLKSHVEWMRGTPEERVAAASEVVNPVGWTTVSELRPARGREFRALRRVVAQRKAGFSADVYFFRLASARETLTQFGRVQAIDPGFRNSGLLADRELAGSLSPRRH